MRNTLLGRLVQAGHHLLLGHRNEIVQVDTTGSEILTLMRRDQARILLGSNR